MKKKAGRPPKEDKKQEKQNIQPPYLTDKTVDGILNKIAEKYYIRIEVDPKNHVDRNGWNVYLEKRRN